MHEITSRVDHKVWSFPLQHTFHHSCGILQSIELSKAVRNEGDLPHLVAVPTACSPPPRSELQKQTRYVYTS